MDPFFLAALEDNTAFTDVLTSFMAIILEGGPFIFLGTLISGFIAAWLPAHTIDRYLPRNRTAAIFLSGLMGAVLPVCECVVVPVMRRLIRKGLPVSCAVTYMLAAPIVNPITVFSTWKAYQATVYGGLYISSTRVLLAYIVTVLVGLIIQRISNRKVLKAKLMDAVEEDLAQAEERRSSDHRESEPDDIEKEPAGVKVIRAVRAARRDFLDTAMYFSIGALITAAFSTQFNQQDPNLLALASNEWSGAAILMIFAFVLSLCSTSDAFLASQMVGVFKVSGQMAFMVFGPMMDVKLIFMYSAVFQKRFILFLLIGLFFVIGILSVVWHYPVPVP